MNHSESYIFDFSRSADEMAVSTFKPVGEVDIDFRANTHTQGPQEPATQGSTLADSNKCGVEKTINKVMSGSRFREPSSLSSGREWEFERESRGLTVRELCQNEHIVPSSITETQATNQNSCNNDNNTRTLQELQHDHEPQQDLTNQNSCNNDNNETTLQELPHDHEPQI
jgi:hypothetical protein